MPQNKAIQEPPVKSKLSDQKADAIGIVIMLTCIVLAAVHFVSGGLIG